jgi:hypothetical protein
LPRGLEGEGAALEPVLPPRSVLLPHHVLLPLGVLALPGVLRLLGALDPLRLPNGVRASLRASGLRLAALGADGRGAALRPCLATLDAGGRGAALTPRLATLDPDRRLPALRASLAALGARRGGLDFGAPLRPAALCRGLAACLALDAAFLLALRPVLLRGLGARLAPVAAALMLGRGSFAAAALAAIAASFGERGRGKDERGRAGEEDEFAHVEAPSGSAPSGVWRGRRSRGSGPSRSVCRRR